MRFTWVALFCYALRQVVCDVTRNCPDVCPTDLMKIGLAIDKLGAASEEVQSLFISVDPECDTTSVLAQYVSMYHPRLLGLTGTSERIRAVEDRYKAYCAKYSPGSTLSRSFRRADNLPRTSPRHDRTTEPFMSRPALL